MEGITEVSPDTKFLGLALARSRRRTPSTSNTSSIPATTSRAFPSITSRSTSTPLRQWTRHLNGWQHTFFDQADGILATSRYILAIRDRLSPQTKIDTDELGVILPTDGQSRSWHRKPCRTTYPHRYWNAAGALYAYLFIELSKLGVDVIGESQLVGYPSQFPSVSMIDYNNGKPNARYWVLKLIKDNFHPGDKLVANKAGDGDDVLIQGFLTPQGKKVLLVNKTNSEKTLQLDTGMQNASTFTVDEETGDESPRAGKATGPDLKLAPFAVVVLSAQ